MGKGAICQRAQGVFWQQRWKERRLKILNLTQGVRWFHVSLIKSYFELYWYMLQNTHAHRCTDTSTLNKQTAEDMHTRTIEYELKNPLFFSISRLLAVCSSSLIRTCDYNSLQFCFYCSYPLKSIQCCDVDIPFSFSVVFQELRLAGKIFFSHFKIKLNELMKLNESCGKLSEGKSNKLMNPWLASTFQNALYFQLKSNHNFLKYFGLLSALLIAIPLPTELNGTPEQP